MAKEAYVLDQRSVDTLRRQVQQQQLRIENMERLLRSLGTQHHEGCDKPGRMYVCKTGVSGIPAMTGTTPGSAKVLRYRRASGGTLVATQDYITAYNHSTTAIAADTYVQVKEDLKSRKFWVEPPSSTARGPFAAVAIDSIEGYRKAGGSVEKFSSGSYQQVGIEINSAGVVDEFAALDTAGTVSAYNIARYRQHSGRAAWLWKDWQGNWVAVPNYNVPQVQIVLSGSWTGYSSASKTETNWTVPTVGTNNNWGDIAAAYTGGGSNDVKFKYTLLLNYEFNYTIEMTPGNSVTAAPNIFYGTINQAVAGLNTYWTPPMIQHGTTNGNGNQDALGHWGSISGQASVTEDSLLGSITAAIVGFTSSTTWTFSYTLRLRPQTFAQPIGVGY